jgi:hypothetical protein
VAVISRRLAVTAAVFASLAASVVAWAAAAAPAAPDLSDIVLTRKRAATLDLQAVVRAHRFTAVVFFSASCPCFAAHRARLVALAREMEPRGVDIAIVDSERRPQGASPPGEVPETDLPILRDDQGRLARRLDAQYATETFVFDSTGALRYRGGIDDDRKHLSQTPKALLREALLTLLSGKAPAFTTAKALGCALRLL